MVDGLSSLELWRYAAHLFHATRNPDWEGPLRAAGFRDYKVNAKLFDAQGNSMQPDITAVSPSTWLLVEVTARPKSKQTQVEAYTAGECRFLNRDHGLPVPEGLPPPELLVIRAQEKVEDGCAQVVVTGHGVTVASLSEIRDPTLQRALAQLPAAPRVNLPSLSIAFAPDCSRTWEVRRGLIPSVMELLQKPTKLATADDLVNEGLDFLADRISVEDRKRLIEIVKQSMEELIAARNGWLATDLTVDSGAYRSARTEPPHHRSLERIATSLGAWVDAGRKPRTTKLPGFSPANES